MIKLTNLTKIYKRKGSSEDVVALNDINLAFSEKGFVAILGASGSGKTTLLNIIGGLDKPTSGSMIVDGLSTSNFTSRQWDSYRNEKIGFVLQNCYLLNHLNVRDNVKIKLQINRKKGKFANELVDKALESVDLLDKKFDRPKALSGGQKQRVAIARAIVNEPTVILADEPTGALDSKTGTQIMELLKELSKEHLVLMVTHNNEYASKYADRVIELKDGTVVNDSNPVSLSSEETVKDLTRVSIPPSTTFKWGLKNLVIKKYSTLSIVIAASLGLAGVGLILSISTSVQKAFDKAEANAFGRYPVTITSYSRQSSEGSSGGYTKYTNKPEVYADYSNYAKQEHYNYMSDRFLTYMGAMPESYYYVTYQSSTTTFNIFAKANETRYLKVSSTGSLFYKGVANLDFLHDQYDCLRGKMPTGEKELALVVDAYNRVNVASLYSLGFDVDISTVQTDVKFNFDDIIGKTYRYITNDDYYVRNSDTGVYSKANKTNKQFYEMYSEDDPNLYELKIVGILRERRDNTNALLNNGIIYTPAFAAKAVSDARQSQIVIEQKEYGVEKNVQTGQPYQDTTGSMKLSAQYQYEEDLYELGQYERVRTIYYYTKNYTNRKNISEYFKNYTSSEEVDFSSLSFNDYLEHASMQFDGALALMTSVLYVFAIISVVVSAILNAILTYISTHQRINEIGLLRSMGARKIDIALMVETESLLTGLLGGGLSILAAILLIKPLNVLVKQAIYQYNFYLLSQTVFDLGGFQWWVAPILVGLALITALISALIPAIIASRKDPAKAISE